MTTLDKLDAITIEPEHQATHCVIWCHGLGADGNDFVPLVSRLKLKNTSNIRFIFPHAPIRPVSINGNMHMRAWFDIYSLSNLERQDEEGIRQSIQQLSQLIDQQIAMGIPARNIIFAGFSQGGTVALLTALSYPQQLAGVIALSTFMMLPDKFGAEATDCNKQTPIFIAHGDADPVLAIRLGKMTRDFLLGRNYPIEWHEYPMGHEVCLKEVADISEWLGQRLIE